jgi:hypothetical protein
MNVRDYPNEWLTRSRWAFVWRMAILWTLFMTGFGLAGVGLAYMQNDPAAWSWMPMYPITLAAMITQVAKNAVSGFLFGWVISYMKRPRHRSTSAV